VASTPRIPVRSVADIAGALRGSLAPEGLVLAEEDLGPDFFDLRTGLAGELFQKVVNYRGRLAIVIRDAGAYGDRFSELAYEHRRHPSVRFFEDRALALQWMDGNGSAAAPGT
jgi:Domain of unknown function (DUF4180)